MGSISQNTKTIPDTVSPFYLTHLFVHCKVGKGFFGISRGGIMSEQPLSINQTWLECIACGHKTDLLEEEKFRCPHCGDLYEVRHNFTGADWEKLRKKFDGRAKGHLYGEPDALSESGVWRYKELINPFLPHEFIRSLPEGNMPITQCLGHLRTFTGSGNLWMIQEGFNPTGAFKDNGMTNAISTAAAVRSAAQMRRLSKITPMRQPTLIRLSEDSQLIGAASTGDTSDSFSAYAARCGMKGVVLVPSGKISMVQLVGALLHGAKVISIPGDFDDCMRIMQDLVRDFGVYPVNSLNPTRIEGHQVTVFRTLQYFNWESWPTVYAVPVGNGSNASSIHKALRTLEELGFKVPSRILGCQSDSSNPLSSSWEELRKKGEVSLDDWRSAYKPMVVGQTTATASNIGNPVSREKVMRGIVQTGGAMVTVSQEELSQAVLEAGKDGYKVCPQTGIAIAGVREAIKRGYIAADEPVMIVSTATGMKFPEGPMAALEKNILRVDSPDTEEVASLIGAVVVHS